MEKTATEVEMVGWHHQFNGHELGQTLEDSEGQRGLVCCSPWGHRVRHDFMTEQQQMGTLNLASLLTYSNKKISSQSPFPFNLPSIRVFSNKLTLHIRWPTDCSFSISPSNECSVLISFRIDWFDVLAVKGTLKSCLQHHSSKASTP